ncbi:MAG: Eco57I restriction-modification methylase domain-containing protein [Gammaproteobacteria bacterium]|nr:Eco57I restriction-modification methylase domain-containing protein [Gammaproteobacteria bacterium]
MLSTVEQTRLRISKGTAAKRKSQLGQFFTPASTAKFMAGLFTPTEGGVCHVVDPGAGIGSLSSAFLEQCMSGILAFDKVELTAFEFDEVLHKELENTLASYVQHIPLSYKLIGGDFIEEAVNRIQFENDIAFTHAILNPPYKKINSSSRYRLLLRQAEIETVNLYSAFVSLTLALMKPGGQIVAIIPRSFCNGPYYRPFRKILLEHAAIRHIHLFESRNKAFKDDAVLQENVIIKLEKNGQQADVQITTSTDDIFSDLVTHTHTFESIILPDDPEYFIHIPTTTNFSTIQLTKTICYSLEDLGIKVSTGPVVDFRLKEHLRDMPEAGTIPLIYPAHFNGINIEWPITGMKKPNAIHYNSDTEKWFYPNGFYCLVRRFSSKEEKRRIMASIVQPDTFPGHNVLGFENHINVFHENKQGLPEALARGLAIYLNTSIVDEHFRRFNGHTQVNATDLKLMKYPSREKLIALGNKTIPLAYDQKAIDCLFFENEEDK